MSRVSPGSLYKMGVSSMAITTEMIKELRQLTGAGVLDCKKALEEAGGDMEKAAEILKIGVATLFRKLKKYDLK